MNVLLAPLLAAPMTEAIISVLVIVIALKLAFLLLKGSSKCSIRHCDIHGMHSCIAYTNGYWLRCVGFDRTGFGPIPMVLAALYYGL